ncbi:MAG: hypothetical protein ACTIJQ_03110 [Alcaligenes sp.]
MTRKHIILHAINQSAYHRGFVSDLMHQVTFMSAAKDLPVFLRDHYHCES